MKYLFFDIDGTLAVGVPGQGQYIPESTREALRRLREAGHFLSIATGRAHAMAGAYAKGEIKNLPAYQEAYEAGRNA